MARHAGGAEPLVELLEQLEPDLRTQVFTHSSWTERRADSYDDANFNRDSLKLRPEIARPLAEELTAVAAALRLYVHLSPLDDAFLANANELLLLAQTLDPEGWEAWIERVRLTRLEREGAFASARKARDIVVRKNPELADLWTDVLEGVGVRVLKRATGAGIGGWGSASMLEHDLYVLESDHARAEAIVHDLESE